MDSKDQFDRQAKHYNVDWNRWNEGSLRWLVQHAKPRKEDHMLDVATGTGFTALAFAPLVGDVTGLDVSTGMLAEARRSAEAANLNNVHFQEGPAEQMPFADQSFDLVTCRVAPHHFLLVTKFATECWRVLRPTGRLLIADTTVPDTVTELEDRVDQWQNHVETLRDPSHVRNYPPREWRAILEGAGFVIDELELCEEQEVMTLRAWLTKSGCSGEPAAEVTRLFEQAPEMARRQFRMTTLPDGDISFQWMRVVMSAHKSD